MMKKKKKKNLIHLKKMIPLILLKKFQSIDVNILQALINKSNEDSED